MWPWQRTLIVQMLRRCRLGAADLLLSWLKGRALAAAMASSTPEESRVRMRGGFKTSGGIDRSGRRGLNRDNFVAKMKLHLFEAVHPDLWAMELLPVVDAVFV